MFQQSLGDAYQYLFGQMSGGLFSNPPIELRSQTQLTSTQLGNIATALCGGTPPSGYTVQVDAPRSTVLSY